MALSKAFWYYRKAVCWSILISLANIMESYDIQLIKGFYAFPQFNKRYGFQLKNGTYQVDANWQLALSLAQFCGLIIGVFANAPLAEQFGPRRVMMIAFVFLTGFISLTFEAQSIQMLFGGELLCALTWGIFAAAAPTYAAEVVPTSLRGYVTTYVNLCWVMGRILSTGVLRGTLSIQSDWSFRIPFAVQWVWPPFLILATYFAPESPWYLARKGQNKEAKRSLDRLVSAPATAINTNHTLSMIQHTIELERGMKVGGSYLDCFKGTNLRRTEIAMVSWGLQILPGFVIQNYTTYFFTLAGLSPRNSFNMSMGTFGMAFVGTCLSWVLQTHMGRRTIYLWGLICMLPIMWIVAGLEYMPDAHTNANIRWIQSALLMIWFFIYGSTIGPIPYAIASEVGATELRAKTIALGRNVYYVLAIVNSGISPYMLNPSRWDLKGKAAFPGAVFTLCMIVWTYFRLPETKGLSPATLDHLFHERISARDFKRESARFQ
ncbi:general substrate transporter [Boeremia exigua]|uniref:general substrate transporter n=1 Tax=Boeremia exigua TaxID=749465 RepID=UPI001E8CA926|nr:general substrate transporter [Boeremia exigua]KAH6613049.1 general substrate transporter [Boeremia exigua]